MRVHRGTRLVPLYPGPDMILLCTIKFILSQDTLSLNPSVYPVLKTFSRHCIKLFDVRRSVVMRVAIYTRHHWWSQYSLHTHLHKTVFHASQIFMNVSGSCNNVVHVGYSADIAQYKKYISTSDEILDNYYNIVKSLPVNMETNQSETTWLNTTPGIQRSVFNVPIMITRFW